MTRKRKLEREKAKLEKKLRRLGKKLRKLDSDSDSKDSTTSSALPIVDPIEDVIEVPIPIESMEQDIQPTDNSPAQELTGDSPTQVSTIDTEILLAMGTVEETIKGPIAHCEIVNRWNPILNKGLTKDLKTELFKAYIPFDNINMSPPKLNPELSAAVSEAVRKRDVIIAERQRQVGIALAALGKSLDLFLKNSNKVEIVRHVNDAAKILCDTIYMDTKSRRSLISSVINKEMKECLTDEPDSLLFGTNLSEKIKATKAVQRSVKDLKNTEYTFTPKKVPNKQQQQQPLNWRGPRPSVRTAAGKRPYSAKPKPKEDKKRQHFRNSHYQKH